MMNATENVTLKAPDISCGHCVATVSKEVGALEGVDRVEASAETKLVTISFDPSRVTLMKIEETLDEAGYPVQR